jgi:Cu(I)/Ag(I) efflux system membrane fusion protein
MNKFLFTAFLILILGSCNKNRSESSEVSHADHNKSTVESYYTCSMHPKVKEAKAGKCPICHMNLTKVMVDTSEEKDISSTDEPVGNNQNAGQVIAKVRLRKSQLSHFKPDFFPVTTMKMSKEIRLLGTVLQSEDNESKISARVGGRIEKVYIKSTGSFVKRGDPVVELYSAQLITAGEEYLIARKSSASSKEFKEMLMQSTERLKLWGIKKSQYESWYKKGKVPRSIIIYSNATGIVRKRNAIVGKYFKEGQNFFELSDLSEVWVEIDVYEHDANLINMGQVVEMEFTAIPGEKVSGEVDFIDPVLSRKSRTLKIRTTVSNKDGKLKPGMVADALLLVEFEGRPLVVPRSAIIDTGKRKVVWVKIDQKQFQAKTILSGYESEGYVEVKEGLMQGEEVVIEGNFLLDAQAQLFGGYESFVKELGQASGHNH